MVVEEEGLRRAVGSAPAPSSARWPVASTRWDSRCCRPSGERLWTLNAVRVPDGVDEAAVRRLSAPALQHGDRRRSGAACRQDLAHRPDGHELDRSAGDAVPGRAGAGASLIQKHEATDDTEALRTLSGDAEDTVERR